MKGVELYGRVRHAVQIEGLSRREAARRFGIDPRTVAKMLLFSVPPGYRRGGRGHYRSAARAHALQGPRLRHESQHRRRDFPRHGTDPGELLKNADIALYAAKAFGRGGFTTYVPSMANTLRKRAATILSVREAIAQHRIEVFYQPKVDLAARRIIGFEALLRMRGSDGSLIEEHALDQAFDDIELARQIGDTMFDLSLIHI